MRTPASLLLLLLLALPSRAVSNIDYALFVGRLNDNRKFSVEYIFAPMPPFKGAPEAPAYWTILQSVRLNIAGHNIPIPRKAYTDLFWPNRPNIPYTTDKDIRLNIQGGDGEYAYTAVLIIRKGRVVARELSRYLSHKPIVTHYSR